jgi:hypothetical protein
MSLNPVRILRRAELNVISITTNLHLLNDRFANTTSVTEDLRTNFSYSLYIS